MNNSLRIIFILLFLGNTTYLVASETKILKEPPKNYTLSFNEIVYVENDGRCKNREVLKVTGGKKSEGIPRKYECIRRPK